jgi:hypothetical protein
LRAWLNLVTRLESRHGSKFRELRLDLGDLPGGRHDIRFIEIGLGRPIIGYPVGRRQGAALGQGRGHDLPDVPIATGYPAGRHYIMNPRNIGGVVVDGPVEDCLIDPGGSIEIRWGRSPVISGGETVAAEIRRRVISRRIIPSDYHRLRIKHLDIRRGYQHAAGNIRIGRGIGLA